MWYFDLVLSSVIICLGIQSQVYRLASDLRVRQGRSCQWKVLHSFDLCGWVCCMLMTFCAYSFYTALSLLSCRVGVQYLRRAESHFRSVCLREGKCLPTLINSNRTCWRIFWCCQSSRHQEMLFVCSFVHLPKFHFTFNFYSSNNLCPKYPT